MFDGEHIEIDTELRLEVLRAEHAEELDRVVSDNRAYLSRTLPWASETSSLKDTREFIALRRRVFEHRRALPLAIVYRGAIVGGVGLDVVDPQTRTGEFGYWLDEHHQGSGLMTRSTSAVLDVAFMQGQMHRIEIMTTPQNLRSCNLADRLGFTLEGTKREAALLGGEWADLRLYSLLRREWCE
ncbi:MAG: GNAT family N-acetyltransferase [Myxococcota bacterium]